MTVSCVAMWRFQITSCRCAGGTLSSPSRCIRSHPDELCASGNIPEIYAPAPSRPPDFGRGYLFSELTKEGRQWHAR
jgi:hypothetical protein